MFQFSSNFLERVNLFHGLKEMLSTNEIQAIKTHLINIGVVLLPLSLIQYAMHKHNEYLFNKNDCDYTHEEYFERKTIINKVFGFIYTLIATPYLFSLLLLNK